MNLVNRPLQQRGANQNSTRGRRIRLPGRMGMGIALFLALTFLYVSVALAAAANIDQCANGSVATPVACAGSGSGSSGWVHGDVNASKAHWKEGDSLPYRMKLSGITSGTWTLQIGWDITKGGTHAIDYLTSFDRTETLAMGNNPCDTVGCDLTNFDTFAIPDDPTGPQHCGLPGRTQIAGVFTIFGATGTTVDITGVSAYGFTSGCPTGDSHNTIQIQFTSTDPNPVIAWAGHIANQVDWGEGNSAAGITGSPYHTNLEGMCSGSPNPCTDGGAQDRALAAAAVSFVSMTTQRNPNTAIPPGGNVSDTATLTGHNAGTSSPTGTVVFYICYKFTSTATDFPPCSTSADADTSLGNPFDTQTVSTTNATGTATSKNFSSRNLGTYCFLAIYVSTNPLYGSITGNITADNQAQECFSLQGATAVTLSSFAGLADPNGSANVLLKWTTGSEVNTAGFNIYRSEQSDGPYTRINAQLIPTSQDQVAGGTYQYTDQAIAAGKTYYYQLEDVEFSGTGTRHSPVAVTAANDTMAQWTLPIVLALGVVVLSGAGLFVFARRRAS